MDKVNLKLDDLTGEQKELARVLGIDIYLKLVEKFGGCSIYIAKEDKIQSAIRDSKIKAEFNGYNYKYLAKKYHLSERRVRDVIDSDRMSPLKGQISIFGEIKE